jgi:hypothetical protein
MAVSRQQLAMRIGGRGLLRAILRTNIKRVLLLKTVVNFKPIELKEFQAAQTAYQNEPIPSVLTTDPKQLSVGDRLWLRNRYYQLVNMPASAVRRWYTDPRTVDCTLNRHPYEMLLVNRQIRDVLSLQSSGHRNGSGWSNRSYATAQKSIFVIQHLFRTFGIQYFAWVFLQSFGHDWRRSLRGRTLRPLPPDTALVATKRLQQLRRTKKPGEGYAP